MNHQVLNFKHQIILLACIFALSSCESIKDKITVDIPFDSFSIQLDDIVVGEEGAQSAIVRLSGEAELNSFSATQVLSMDMLTGAPADLEKYRSKIEKVEVGSISITITSTDANGTVVEDFLVKATGINGQLSVDKFELGIAENPPANSKQFAVQVLMKLLNNNNVTLDISGKTDVASGEKLQVTIAVENGNFKAKALD